MSLSKELLEILVCPKCKGKLEYRENEDRLICMTCELGYPVKDDIPIMIVDQAHTLSEQEIS